jgi:hypothetical protein
MEVVGEASSGERSADRTKRDDIMHHETTNSIQC